MQQVTPIRLLQLNTTVNSGSTGRIVEGIGQLAMAKGYESYIAYGRGDRPSQSQLIKIGGEKDILLHGLKTALFDRHGFGSKNATESFLKKVERIRPDLINLHNLHGYYLHIGNLFHYLRESGKPVVWTFHDCWPFTGHCAYFGAVDSTSSDCMKWKTQCQKCPKKARYPRSVLLDNSRQNYSDKKWIFNSLHNLTIVTPSKWLSNLVKKSFFNRYPVEVIHNGIDLEQFRPQPFSEVFEKYEIEEKKVVLGVANRWDKRKGLEEFIRLRAKLPRSYTIILVGLNRKQIAGLPENIVGIPRTESIGELAALYTGASVFVNPTFLDNFPTTNIEALACGTPVITYNTGGSAEAIDEQTGRVVEKGDIGGLVKAIEDLMQKNPQAIQHVCRQRAEKHFDKNECYRDYLRLYEAVVEAHNTASS